MNRGSSKPGPLCAASGAQNVERACEDAARILDGNPVDVPFSLLYRVCGDGKEASLAAASSMIWKTSLIRHLTVSTLPLHSNGLLAELMREIKHFCILYFRNFASIKLIKLETVSSFTTS